MSGADALLVVDDDERNRFTLTRRLKHLGYTDVTVAEHGLRALELLATRRFDLVLLDIMMPEVDGYQVLERMRADRRWRDIPVIMVSAVDELESVVRCIELGAEDYLPKPFNPTLLRARVAASLEKKRLRDEVAQQLQVIQGVFGKYVPESVARAIVLGQGRLEPTHADVTILYTDIEAFTGIAESLPPERVVQMLNEYFTAVIEPVTEHRGVINQFQGDAMLVTFNVPVADPRHADHAVQAAQGIQAASRDRTFAGVSLRTRIGISTGRVIAGNVGSGTRMNYTVHGDAVNLAARLEELNKEYGTRVLVSATTVDLLTDTYPLESVGTVPVRGRSGPVTVFRLNLADPR